MAEFWLWFEKFLRKMRLVVMKLDGKMVATLERLRQKNSKTVEEWKRMAEAAEKNIQMHPAFFAGKNTLKKRKRSEDDPIGTTVERKAENAPVLSQETAVFYEEAGMVAAPQGEELLEEGKVWEVEAETKEPEERDEAAEERAAQAYFASQEEVEDIRKEPAEAEMGAEEIAAKEAASEPEEVAPEILEEKIPEDYSEEITAERNEGIENTIEKIEEFEEELDGLVVAENAPASAEEAEEEGELIAGQEDNIRTKKEQECIDILMQNPADVKAYWKLGIIYSKRCNYEDALACFRQIVKIDPTYTKAKQKVIEVMEKMKKRGK